MEEKATAATTIDGAAEDMESRGGMFTAQLVLWTLTIARTGRVEEGEGDWTGGGTGEYNTFQAGTGWNTS